MSVFCEVEAELSKLKLSDIFTETGFDPRPVYVGFMINKDAMKPVYLRVFSCQFHPIIIFFLITAFTRTNEQSVGILNKQSENIRQISRLLAVFNFVTDTRLEFRT